MNFQEAYNEAVFNNKYIRRKGCKELIFHAKLNYTPIDFKKQLYSDAIQMGVIEVGTVIQPEKTLFVFNQFGALYVLRDGDSYEEWEVIDNNTN